MGGWPSHLWGVFVFLAAVTALAGLNVLFLPRLRPGRKPDRHPLVSVLIPAWDEEENIVECVSSVLAQDYPSLEVLVLDDKSSDRTRQLVRDLSQRDGRVRLIEGTDPPPGWLGKSWACYNLYRESKGKLLLFTDADVRLRPGCLSAAVAGLQASGADVLTLFPRQLTGSFGERALLAILQWSVLSFYPLFLAGKLKAPGLAVTVGQFILVRRAAYEAAGTHLGVRGEVVEDIALGRRIIESGGRWRFLLDGGAVDCRMYRGLGQAFSGLVKGIFPAFGGRVLIFLFIWTWLSWVFSSPPVFFALSLASEGFAGTFAPALACIGMSVALWSLSLLVQRQNPALAFLYPMLVLTGAGVASYSMFASLTGRASWKGRPLPPVRPRFP
ncbi:MAG: glycosyltransferase family 2 protein [Candidatus Geothermincolales bacterium]